jgi:hypothetical protein
MLLLGMGGRSTAGNQKGLATFSYEAVPGPAQLILPDKKNM